jgi:pyruvate,water dikinase
MQRVAAELGRLDLAGLPDEELAAEIARREATHLHWIDVYWADFIPLAHGVRLFGQVYNDTVKPEDPYEFMSLLAETPMQSLKRNALLEELASMIRDDRDLATRLARGEAPGEGGAFAGALEAFLSEFGSLRWRRGEPSGEERSLIPLLLELAERGSTGGAQRSAQADALRERFLAAFPDERREFAEALLDLGRASHQLRDDDNIYLSRIEERLAEARDEARRRTEGGQANAPVLAAALERADSDAHLDHGTDRPSHTSDGSIDWTVRSRQLLGQPAGPGVASGSARVVIRPSDLFAFKRDEILVCDAVDPSMTLVVPLAAGIVERRGGMLIHGAIIAREYGLPCVTGVPEATKRIRTGDRLTVDGHLGLVVCNPRP